MWYPLLVEGTPFGRYRLLDLLGAGAMGEVHRAYDTGTDRLVAVKVLAPEFAHDAVYRKRFQREAQVAARLAEPHIVPIHDFGEIDGRLFLDMRLVQAPNLAELLAERDRLEAGEAVEVVAQIAAALDAAHAEGLVHRDVKPSNILVTPKGFAYLIDFGIARSDEDTTVTTTGAVIGTFAYMAPERLADDESGTASDVYSLACVLYECLVGAKPYRGESMQRQIAAHLNDEPPLPSTDGLPQAFDAVIAKGMAKDPADRYETAGELAAAARAALWEPRTEPSPVPAAAPPVPDPETQDSMAPSRPIPPPVTPSAAPDQTPIAAENPAPATTPDPAPYAVSGLAPDTPPNPAPTPRPPWRAIVVMSVLALAIAGTSALALTQDNSTLVTETPATAPPAVSSTVREPVPSAPRSVPPEPPPAPAPAPAPAPPVSVTESVPITSAAPGGPVVEPAPPPVWTEPEPQPSEPPPPPPVTTTSPPPVTTTSSEPTESETTTPETTTPETTTPETTVTTTEEGGEEVAGETGADATGSTIATSSAVGPTDGTATPPTTETAASPSTTGTMNGTATTSSTEGTAAGPSSTSYTSGNTATPPPNAVG
ncbi:serine/threonine-protein kinase [Nocardia carnea]|uniref:serine/threonine-protein kinase n=1 Tax=Nocardia carnea TaxID=37328 RepID=UPI002453EDF7|nr:serine/threonine-protein kinase [Nocardia carnea]